jgi:hypothetical protein
VQRGMMAGMDDTDERRSEDSTPKEPADKPSSRLRWFTDIPIPRKPFCLKCGEEVDSRIGFIDASGTVCCPKCGLPLNCRSS